ncbi:ribonuclease III [Lentisphaera profundi]|uniref:Ribonuclease 3 n=1 Tax=Lentisphaera profundi TaxID=1658616 RepID=A0ABY7VPE7_9BACT|nr:ribonuclease III [Lentisphaera profundi]WDE96015.1 ribonuclease III [Lentisphaera profundi]
MTMPLSALEKKINCLFNNKELLNEAMTHRSYRFESQVETKDNQRLEFLGDAVIELIVSRYLFDRYSNAPEGDMTKYRAALVQESALFDCARHIDLGHFLLLGKSELTSKGNERPSNLSDAYEALIAAIYIDQGYEKAQVFHIQNLEALWNEPADLVLVQNPKGILQEITQKNHGSTPKYATISKSGPEHEPKYKVDCYLNRELLAHGEGKTLKSAQENAATHAINRLKEDKNK